LLGVSPVGKVLVVGVDNNWEGGTLEIVMPGIQSSDDGQKFPVIDLVIMFSQGEGL